ncbi:hypothetical protein ELQ35_13920 [Peribacillus cavernae]|uniref:Small, acid-soluble spore protein N n=1 Tax=Peribacillus cavernae TaxID=1674310 RepID=A0A433HI38_9BACI|nr:hypothetical protein [Peribacillus cavernae]MDQ0220499.1 flagellar biosynthesis chaperone FliJ [Peribacillus cavernae]RUQ28007.1 hypothetical protein ELQ35_13920 [Peribacillus cavernae]
MPYHKDKQQSFQAAEQGVKEAADVYSGLVRDDEDYASQLKYVKQEVNEAIQQIENALENASEQQRDQLMQYLDDLKVMIDKTNESH